MNTENISVIGSGSWGSALAQVVSTNAKSVTIWTRSEDIAKEINQNHTNSKYLEGINLSSNILATNSLEAVMKNDIVLIVTPAQAMRSVIEKLADYMHKDHVFVLCSKGIEQKTNLLMSNIVKETTSCKNIAVLSGPNFAREIALGKPAAATLASNDIALAEQLQEIIATPYFRPYASNDIIGAQIAGAIKNVIAIACGIVKGLDLGENARASLITRGLAETTRLGFAMGAQKETFLGLCGVGDMMLTCSSEQSRNFSFGLKLGKGMKPEEILANSKGVTEGAHTAVSVINLANSLKIDMPICEGIHKCINDGVPLTKVIQDILTRPLKSE